MLSKIDVMDTDILCGRGRGLESFPGNTIFRRIIKEHADMYGRAKTSRAEKSRLVRLVADRLAEEDMRFVKKVNKKDWVALEDSDAKLKVCCYYAGACKSTANYQFSSHVHVPCLRLVVHFGTLGSSGPRSNTSNRIISS